MERYVTCEMQLAEDLSRLPKVTKWCTLLLVNLFNIATNYHRLVLLGSPCKRKASFESAPAEWLTAGPLGAEGFHLKVTTLQMIPFLVFIPT